jgi:Xanthine/uracil permeases
MLIIAPIALILIAENLGHIKAVGAMTGENLDPHIGKAFVADGIATTLAGGVGAPGMTTYGENIGVMAVTRVYSTIIFAVAVYLRYSSVYHRSLVRLFIPFQQRF